MESDSEAGVETQSEYSFPAPQEPEITPIPFHSLGKPRSFSSFQSLADIAGIVKQRVQWTPSPTHYVQSTTPSGGNQLQSSMNLEAKINEKALRETQTLRAGCSKVEPKNFRHDADRFPGAHDSQNLISWRLSLPLPTNPVW